MSIDGGSLAQNQGQNKNCYAYAETRMILNLMKNLKIIKDIKDYPFHLEKLNEIEYGFMNKNLPQVKKFINGDSKEFNEINNILNTKTTNIKTINDYYINKNTENDEINKSHKPAIDKIDTEIDNIKKK